MQVKDLVEIKRSSHRGFIIKILGTKCLVFDCDAKRNCWYSFDEVKLICGFDTVLRLFEKSLSK